MLDRIFLFHALLNFLLLGNFAGFVLGAVLILRPAWLKQLSALLNRRLATPQLNRSIPFEPWFYRYRYVSGISIFLGALYVLAFFSAFLDRAQTVESLAEQLQLSVTEVDVLFDPLVLIVLLGATLALFISLFILFRPSLLREFEHGANRWISLRHSPLEISHVNVDEFALRYAQQVGVLLLLGSLYAWVLLILLRI